MKMKTKSKKKSKMKIKTKMSFCIFVNSTWPRVAIVGQLSLDWPRSAITFLLTSHGLEMPQTVNCLLLGLEVS